jgi:hypothetical protein
MAAITWDDVVDHAASLVDVDPGQQTDLLALVNTQLNVGAFGGEDAPKTKLARIYFVAHFASLPSDEGSSAGPVVSESTGRISRAYQALSGTTEGWDETRWGRLYQLLLRGSRARWPRVT